MEIYCARVPFFCDHLFYDHPFYDHPHLHVGDAHSADLNALGSSTAPEAWTFSVTCPCSALEKETRMESVDPNGTYYSMHLRPWIDSA